MNKFKIGQMVRLLDSAIDWKVLSVFKIRDGYTYLLGRYFKTNEGDTWGTSMYPEYLLEAQK